MSPCYENSEVNVKHKKCGTTVDRLHRQLGIAGGKGETVLTFFEAAMLKTAVSVEHGLADQLCAGQAKLVRGEGGGGEKFF